MNRIILVIFVALMGGLIFQSCHYVQREGSGIRASRVVTSTSIRIVNGSDRNLVFKLSADKSSWTRHRLGAQSEDWYSALDSRGAWIKIRTERQGDEPVMYQLENGMTYCLYWNQKARRWDLKQQRFI